MGRKPKGSEGGGGGGHDASGMMRWLLTYSDMMTLLFAFAIIMYSVANLDAKKFESVAKSIRIGFGNAGPTAASQGAGGIMKGGVGVMPGAGGYPIVGRGSIMPPLVNLSSSPTKKEMQKIAEQFNAGSGKLSKVVTVTSDERGIVVQVFEGKPMFETGKADLRPSFIRLLDAMAPILKKMGNPIRIEGHTDDVPINTDRFPSNWELSAYRAINVLRYLNEHEGIPASRLSAVGYSSTHNLFLNDTASHRALNRRVEIVILKGGSI